MLVVIDMQYKFEAAYAIVPEVCEAIIAAKEKSEPIILVEFFNKWVSSKDVEYHKSSATIAKIKNLLSDYKKTKLVQKDEDNGSQFIKRKIRRFPAIVKVCGVNTAACIRATVESLASQHQETEFVLLSEACNDDELPEYSAFNWTHKYENVSRT